MSSEFKIGEFIYFNQGNEIQNAKILNVSRDGDKYYVVNKQQYGNWFNELEIFPTKEDLVKNTLNILGVKLTRQASVGFIVRDGLILSISRKEDRTKFGIIGGGVEILKGELPPQAFIREVKEETGINVIQCEMIWGNLEKPLRVDGDDVYSYCFHATEWNGEPVQQSDEGELKWLTVAELIDANSAFPVYNKKAIGILQKIFPEVLLK